jgi:UPF0755 protein
MADKGYNDFLGDKDETRTFSPVSGISGADGETKAFLMDGGPKEPLEKCEERGSLKEYSTGFMVWRVLRPLLILAASLGLVFFVGTVLVRHVEGKYLAPVSAETTEYKQIEIKTGSSLSGIAGLLYQEGIIRNKFVFQMYVDFNDKASSLQAGKYQLSPGMTMEQIMDILAAGDGGRKIVKITFTEGMTVEDIASKLVTAGVFDDAAYEQFLSLCNDKEAFADNKYIKNVISSAQLDGRKYLLEGYLFPDTYEIYADATPKDVIEKLLDRFDDVFTLQYEDKAKELDMTVDQVMTLASIIEWEALPKDFKKVSAVFNNRLDSDMQLDSCATLRYVTGLKKFVYTAEEQKIDSPYNTYKIAGLPIGPIANPGQKAIEAALYPDEEFMAQGYLYFCNKDPETGDLAFAKDLKEHEANVAMYSPLW